MSVEKARKGSEREADDEKERNAMSSEYSQASSLANAAACAKCSIPISSCMQKRTGRVKSENVNPKGPGKVKRVPWPWAEEGEREETRWQVHIGRDG